MYIKKKRNTCADLFLINFFHKVRTNRCRLSHTQSDEYKIHHEMASCDCIEKRIPVISESGKFFFSSMRVRPQSVNICAGTLLSDIHHTHAVTRCADTFAYRFICSTGQTTGNVVHQHDLHLSNTSMESRSGTSPSYPHANVFLITHCCACWRLTLRRKGCASSMADHTARTSCWLWILAFNDPRGISGDALRDRGIAFLR